MSAEEAFLACQNTIQPLPPQDLVTSFSPAMSSLMRSMGIGQCTTFDTKQDIFFATSQTGVSVGCEQISIMSQILSTTQRVLQCTVSAVSQTTSTQVMTSNDITVRLTGHAHIDCLTVQQTIQAKIASLGEFGAEVITDMGAFINDTVKSFASNVQDASKDVTTPQGQKSLQLFVQQLEQTSNQSGFSNIVQEAINNFQASNNFVLEMDGYAFVGAASPFLGQNNCVTIVQEIMMEVLVQNIMNATLENTFSTDVAAEFTAEWINAQKSVAKTPPSLMSELGQILSGAILGIIIIAVVVVAALMLLKGGGINNIMGTPDKMGDRGRSISIFFIVLGIIVLAAGIACAATGFSTTIGAIAIVIGIICIAIAGYMLYRSQALVKKRLATESAASTTTT
jgi:hypothetical protein